MSGLSGLRCRRNTEGCASSRAVVLQSRWSDVRTGSQIINGVFRDSCLDPETNSRTCTQSTYIQEVSTNRLLKVHQGCPKTTRGLDQRKRCGPKNLRRETHGPKRQTSRSTRTRRLDVAGHCRARMKLRLDVADGRSFQYTLPKTNMDPEPERVFSSTNQWFSGSM